MRKHSVFFLIAFFLLTTCGFAQVNKQQAILDDETLSHMAASLANKCDEILENFEAAVAWYESVLTNPKTSFNDSIFAAIDLGDLYLLMEEHGTKGITGKLAQYVPESINAHQKQTNKALSLLPKIVKDDSSNIDSNAFPPVTDLEAWVHDNNTVSLTWSIPEGCNSSPTVLSWAVNDTIQDEIQYGFDSYMGNLYDVPDLRHFIGWKIDSVAFYKISNWTHMIYVWEEKQDKTMQVLFSQEVPDTAPFGLNTIALEEDLFVEQNTKYWIGLRITRHEGQQGYMYPFGMVRFDGVDGKSNLIMDASTNSTWEINPYSYLHFWIRTSLSNPLEEYSKGTQSLNGYNVYRNGELIQEIPYAFVTYYTDADFSKRLDLDYCVIALYEDGESEEVCTTATVTGVRKTELKDSFILSPNPSESIVWIEGDGMAKIEVLDLLGQKVFERQSNHMVSLDVSEWSRGIYIVNITSSDGRVETGKLLVR